MKTQQSEHTSRITALSRYFFRCPPRKLMLFVMFAAALLFPIAGSDLFSKTRFFIFLIAPAIVSALASSLIVIKLGGNFKEKHAYFLSAVSMFGIAILLAIVSLVEGIYPFKIWNILEILFVGLSAMFIMQILVFAAVGGISIYRATLPASLYLIFSSIILYSFRMVAIKTFVRISALAVVSFLLVYIFIELINAPFKRTLGISTFELITLAIMEYANPGSINSNPFKNIGKNLKVPFQAIKWDTGKEKYLMAVPWLHPGPVESVGGKLPRLIASKLGKNFKECAFAHTYVDHTLNPTNPEEVANKIKEIANSEKFYSKATEKATPFIEMNLHGANVVAQKIGKNYFFISSFAPKRTDDISPSVGFAFLQELKNNAIFIDGHNSFAEKKEMESLGFWDEQIKNLNMAIKTAKQKLDGAKQVPFKISVASSKKDFIKNGIRNLSVIVFEVGKQKSAMVVLDTNNITTNFRESVRNKLKENGFDIVEAITTDAHLGDIVIKIYEEGIKGNNEIEKEIVNVAQEALGNLKPANAYYLFADLTTKVFGEKLTHGLIATAHSIIPFAKFLAISLSTAFLFAAYIVLQV